MVPTEISQDRSGIYGVSAAPSVLFVDGGILLREIRRLINGVAAA